jgi:hypothetical protein
MRAVRRLGLLTFLMLLAMLPAAAAMSPVDANTADIPLAVSQPMVVGVPAVTSPMTGALSDPRVLAVVGTGLMGLASFVRRMTKND